MRVQILQSQIPQAILPSKPYDPAALTVGWRPRSVLGATSAGGLQLPDAHPSASTMYAPRGVWIDAERVIAADSGNHRILIWHGSHPSDGADADVVLGQPDLTSEGPAAGGAGTRNGLHLPTGVIVVGERLVVADAWHHRVLVWDRVPDQSATPPDHVIGQATFEEVEPNRGGEATANSFYWPFGVRVIDGRFYVCDSNNRRVLVWRDGLPLDGRPADVILGQSDAQSRSENRDGPAAANSFRWPHDVAGTGRGGIFVADAGNHRLLRWDEHPDADCPADGVIGQPDFETAAELPYVKQDGRLRFPYGLAGGPGLLVADTANNRVLIWNEAPGDGDAPDGVLAQPDFGTFGENRWQMVVEDSLCWPYGLARHGDTLAIADSGNNRIVLWERAEG